MQGPSALARRRPFNLVSPPDIGEFRNRGRNAPFFMNCIRL